MHVRPRQPLNTDQGERDQRKSARPAVWRCRSCSSRTNSTSIVPIKMAEDSSTPWGRLTSIPASQMKNAEMNQQEECLLFKLPGELRQQIYHFLFSADDIPQAVMEGFRLDSAWLSYPQVHTALLRTCRALYAETYALPVRMNPVYFFHGTAAETTPSGKPMPLLNLTQGVPRNLAAWQYASISSVVLNTQQIGLEQDTGNLERVARRLRATERHSGLYVAENHDVGPQDWIIFPRYHLHTEPPTASETGFSHARPITHLTIRLDLGDMWTWSNRTSSTERNNGYALDPTSEGFMSDPEAMRQRTRLFQQYEPCGPPLSALPRRCWGARIGRLFPDLRSLTVQWEGWKAREREIDGIVDCAKSWVFLIGRKEDATTEDEPARRLRWVGHVEASEPHEQLARRSLTWH
jgi:hypothetical protein